MQRRGFLRLVGAAVLGVMAAKVPVFAEELPVWGSGLEGLLAEQQAASMWVYPVYYSLPTTIDGVAVQEAMKEWVRTPPRTLH